jgi:hypothetical protein
LNAIQRFYFAVSAAPVPALPVPEVLVADGWSSMHFSLSCPVNVSQRPLVVVLVEPVDELPLAPALVSDEAGAVVPDALSVLVPVVAVPEVPAP